MRIGILSSYYPGARFDSQVNHRAYADRHGYHHIFNSGPEPDGRGYFHKIQTLQRYMGLFDWVWWIDDDAYFTDFDKPLTGWIADHPDSDFIVCKSPSTKKLFTEISSGQFLLKCTPLARRFLEKALRVDLAAVRSFWHDGLGYFSNGDQDAFVYLLKTDPDFQGSFMARLDHNAFNNREFEFVARADEHFLVHFTGAPEVKVATKRNFCERLGCNKYIVPGEILARYTTVPNDALA